MKVYIINFVWSADDIVDYRETWYVASSIEKAKVWICDHRDLESKWTEDGITFTKYFVIEEMEVDEDIYETKA